ncbi:hypothetical protein [Sphingomonas mali]|uniref:hypothetical protein n=1 Tax=Sphingomonas mali TaxID=40682 RepID=UPI001471B2A6
MAYVLVEVCDVRGRLCPNAPSPITAQLQGPAKLAAFGNADPRNAVSVQRPGSNAFRGRALAIVRPNGSRGLIQLHVASPGLGVRSPCCRSDDLSGSRISDAVQHRVSSRPRESSRAGGWSRASTLV